MAEQSRAFWVTEPGRGEIRTEPLTPPGPDDVQVRAVCSGVSRGTETLVFRGEVPTDQHTLMRAPFQDGDFPGPVKYGYLSVGIVEQGPPPLDGQLVFCLHPHQSRYVVPARAVMRVPAGVPPERAVLAGTMETALNAVWDAGVLPGDRVTVVGAGIIGCCLTSLLARIPAVNVAVVDIDTARSSVVERLGAVFEHPGRATGDRDLVFHTSATSEGLQTSLALLGPEGSVVELSWYGDRPVRVALGGGFHSGRLAIRASQVGRVAPRRRDRRTLAERIALALDLLRDPALDSLHTGSSPLASLPGVMPRLADGSLPALLHTITYDEESPCSP